MNNAHPATGGEFYKDFPRTCAPDDYWRQVGRTINGQPVSETQIRMIVDAVNAGLELREDDYLVDLCCGNGALSRFFLSQCRGGVGVDFSPSLIEIARRDFLSRASESYELMDVVDYIRQAARPERFSKALCYGAFQYLPSAAAASLLATLRKRFAGVTHFYIGNLPDKGLMSRYFDQRPYIPGVENSADSVIGIWRTETEFARLAGEHGWNCRFLRMPEQFYGAAYRFDAALTPA